MDMAWFIYTVALMLLVIVACSVCFMVWTLTSRHDWLVSAAAVDFRSQPNTLS